MSKHLFKVLDLKNFYNRELWATETRKQVVDKTAPKLAI